MSVAAAEHLRTLSHDPFSLLAQLDASYSRGAESAASGNDNTWAALTARVAGEMVLIPQSDIREIRDMPPCTRVPMAKRWLLGLANVRGDLLSVVDLGQFLTGLPATLTQQSRLLVLNHAELSVGFLVDRVEGMRRYQAHERRKLDASSAPPAFRPHLLAAFVRDGDERNVLGLKRLTATTEFMNANV